VERFERNYNVTYGNRSLASSSSATKNAGQVTRQAIVTTPQAVSEPSIPAVAQTKITAKTTMTPTSNSVATQPTAPAPVSTNNEIRYTVKTGDTLWNIAKRFNVTVGELRTWNKLSEKAQVKVGNVLLIKAPAVNPTNVSTYTVKVGDTLFSIAQAHGLHLAQIVQSNPQLNKESKLTPGTVIFLPPKN
jgi:membrane-bound lytic murein transglycosylase D